VMWRAADEEPVYPHLAAAPGVDGLLDALASFHAGLAAASGGAGGAELGRVRRERYVFTRRTLLAAMALLADRVAGGTAVTRAVREALDMVYVQRVQPGPDRQAVRTALRTVGLGSEVLPGASKS
jgi:hypothetical protein